MDKVKRIIIASEDEKLKDILNFCFDGWGYEVFLQNLSRSSDSAASVESIKKFSPDVIILDIQFASKEQINICQALKENFTTAFIPIITLINKKQLRAQLLNLKQGIDDFLIKPPDPLDLRVRIEMAIRRSHYSMHASSLTGLPGTKILEDILKDKFKKKDIFSFGYLDIDNFKAFNDVYGYQKGDKVLLQTAYMLDTASRKSGSKDGFISHIGGDDFAFVVSPKEYEQVCTSFIDMFDSIIPFHYSRRDREQGYITTQDRSRRIKNIPLMSVSIAVVNKDEDSSIKNIIEINERISEIKRYLKTIPASKFMTDRRENKMPNHQNPKINKKTPQLNNYRPLGQMLIDQNLISADQLDEALTVNWKKGIALGEILKDLGYLNEEKLNKVLIDQKTPFSTLASTI